MPPINHVAISAGAIAVSVAVAAAIALYESPELRRNIDELRRRVAIALHSMGDGMEPPEREPRFNRPEDAHGFYESRRGAGAEPVVDADEESRRRQREELMYWNAIHLEKMSRSEQGNTEALPPPAQSAPIAALPAHGRTLSFDDFMQQDGSGERGSFVINSGADVRQAEDGLRRRADGSRHISPAVYSNPFADEHQIDRDELETPPLPAKKNLQADRMSDIYSSTTYDPDEAKRILATIAPAAAVGGAAAATAALVDIAPEDASERSETLDRELGEDEYMTAGQDDQPRDEAYASIQAWAQGSSVDFYSPLPMSPPSAPMSEPEVISEGMLTPTDSVSVVGSGEDVANDAASSRNEGETGRPYDVLSESEGMMTPASWSEVGSVISESDSPQRVHAM